MNENNTNKTETEDGTKDKLTSELREKIEARRVIIAEKCAELGYLMIEHYMNLDGVSEDPDDHTEPDFAVKIKEEIASNFSKTLMNITESRAGIIYYLKDEDDRQFWNIEKVGYDPVGRNIFQLLSKSEKLLSRFILSELTDFVESGTNEKA